jgi:chemotaxis protein MotB
VSGKKCPECPDEGLPGWMGTFADMMTLLFAFFVLMFSMATMDPVKMAAFSDAQAEKQGGVADTKDDKKGGGKSTKEIEEQMEEFKQAGVTEIEGIPIDEYTEIAVEKAKKDNKKKLNLSEVKFEFEYIIEELDVQDSASVSTSPRGVALELDGDLCFESGEVSMKPRLRTFLDESIERIMTADNDLRPITVEGHTDSDWYPSGKLAKTYPTNWELSSARASEVVKYLILKGVNSSRLRASGFADQWPVGVTWREMRSGNITLDVIAEKNSTPELKQKNRRIKIIIDP